MKTVWTGDDVAPAPRLPIGVRRQLGIVDRVALAVFSHAAQEYVIYLDHVRTPGPEVRCWQDPAAAPEYLEDRLWERVAARRPVAMPSRRVLL